MIYTESYRVRTYEASCRGDLSLMSLANYFQDTADRHAILLGVGRPELARTGLAWVLHRMKITIYRWPKVYEEIIVETNPSGLERVYVFRDFRVYDQERTLLATASSTWLVFDTTSRRLTAPSPHLHTIFEPFKHLSFLSRPSRVFGRQRDLPFAESTLRARHNEIDTSAHVNNSTYFQWLMEPLSVSFMHTHWCEEVEIQFKKECLREDLITSRCTPGETSSFLHVLLTHEGKEAASAITRWQPVSY